MATRRLLTRREVERIVKMPRSSLYEEMTQGGFPKPIRVGKRRVRWVRG